VPSSASNLGMGKVGGGGSRVGRSFSPGAVHGLGYQLYHFTVKAWHDEVLEQPLPGVVRGLSIVPLHP